MKRFLQTVSMIMLVAMLCTFVAVPANAFFGTNYTNAENTFDIYDSNTKKALTSGNSAITMQSQEVDGTLGWMYVHTDVNIGGYQFHDGDRIFYHITPELKNNSKIGLLFEIDGQSILIYGKVHTYKSRTVFTSITKIDGLGGSTYLKYTKSKQ